MNARQILQDLSCVFNTSHKARICPIYARIYTPCILAPSVHITCKLCTLHLHNHTAIMNIYILNMQLKICTIDRQMLQELSIFLTLVFTICSLFFHYHFLLTTCHVTSKSMNLYISFLSKNYLTSLSDFPVRV